MNDQDIQDLFDFHVYNYLVMRGMPNDLVIRGMLNLANSLFTADNLPREPVDGGILAVYLPQSNTLLVPEHLRPPQNVQQTGQSSANSAMQTNIPTALPSATRHSTPMGSFRGSLGQGQLISTPTGSGSHFPARSEARMIQDQPVSNLLGKRTWVQGQSSSTSSIAAQLSVPQEMDSARSSHFVFRFDFPVYTYLFMRGMLNLAYTFATAANLTRETVVSDEVILALYWPQSNSTLLPPERLRPPQIVHRTGQSSANSAMQTNISTAFPFATHDSTQTRGNFGGLLGQGQLISTPTGSGSHFPFGTDARMMQEQPASNVSGKRTRGQSENPSISNTGAQLYVLQEMDLARSSRLSMQPTSRVPPPGTTYLKQSTNWGTDLQMGPKPSMQETSIKLPPGGTYIRERHTNSGTDSKKGPIAPTEHVFKVPRTPSAPGVAALPKQETSHKGKKKTDSTPTDGSHPKPQTSDEGSPTK